MNKCNDPDHHWIIVSLASLPGVLVLRCKFCGAMGVVREFTAEEYDFYGVSSNKPEGTCQQGHS